jgi:hypothetical protein
LSRFYKTASPHQDYWGLQSDEMVRRSRMVELPHTAQRFCGAVATALLLLGSLRARAEGPSTPGATETRKAMTTQVRGSFEVKLVPQGTEDKVEGLSLGRLTIAKQFHGELEGTSQGQMLTGMTEVPGSAGYVAMERVTGTLKGKRGSFLLQHSGTMSKAGGFQLSVTVVPDSGTAQLLGLRGKMDIEVVDGKHFYVFEYTLPETQ